MLAITRPPIVEIDTEATAVYVRFGRGKVARTEPFGAVESLIMVDYDRSGKILGIELIGREEFGITQLLRGIPTQVEDKVLSRTRYVSVDLAGKPAERP